MSRGLNNPPSPNTLNQDYAVNVPDMVYATYEPLYDYQTKTQAATSEQRFFVDPVGTGGKTISDTNMELSGQIPAGQRFAITGIQVEVYPDAPLADNASQAAFAQDVYNFYKSGALIFRIGSIDIIRQGNLMKFPPVNRLSGFAATSTTETTATETQIYASAGGREYAVNKLQLVANQNFSVVLVNTSALSTTARIGITLNGWKYRNAQ